MKVIYDAPVHHSTGDTIRKYGENHYYKALLSLEEQMFKEIMDMHPTKIFLEGVPKGKNACDYFPDNNEGTWAHVRNLSKNGVPIEGMENNRLYDINSGLLDKCDKFEDLSRSYLNKLFEEGDLRKIVPFIRNLLVTRFVYLPISHLVAKLRTLEMARYVAKSLNENDVAVMVHGDGHDVRGVIEFIEKGVRVEPINSAIEKDFELYGEMFMASIF